MNHSIVHNEFLQAFGYGAYNDQNEPLLQKEHNIVSGTANVMGYLIGPIIGIARIAFASTALYYGSEYESKRALIGHLVRGCIELTIVGSLLLPVIDTVVTVGRMLYAPPKSEFNQIREDQYSIRNGQGFNRDVLEKCEKKISSDLQQIKD